MLPSVNWLIRAPKSHLAYIYDYRDDQTHSKVNVGTRHKKNGIERERTVPNDDCQWVKWEKFST